MLIEGSWNTNTTNLLSKVAHSLPSSRSGQIPVDTDTAYQVLLFNPTDLDASVNLVYGGANSISFIASCIAVAAMISIAYVI